MPARFINVSNSGRARFTNVNNSGRAVFGVAGAAPTTTVMASINFYAVQIAPTVPLDFHYSTDGGLTWNFVGTSIGTTCANVATLRVPIGSDLQARIGSNSNINAVYTSNRATNSQTCPSYPPTGSCNWPVLTNVASRDYAWTVNQEQSGVC